MDPNQAVPAPAAPTPTPTPAAPPPEPQYDFSWLDQAADYAMAPPEPDVAPAPQPPAQPANPIQSAMSASREALMREFIQDPQAFIDRRAQELAAKEINPLREVLGGFIREMQAEKVRTATDDAINRLKQVGGRDPALQNEVVRKQVAGIYYNLIRNAANGDSYALNALRHPSMPVYAVQMAKEQIGWTGGGNAPAPTVSYQGGRLESGGTVGVAPTQLTDADAALMQQWGIPPEKWAENERMASR